ncbi:MAG: hypothetical protein WBG13_13220, partial [Pseudolabrys sp.]
SSASLTVGMRERLGGRLRPPSRLGERRIRRRTGGDEGDIDDPRGSPQGTVDISWTWLTND